jgi:protein-disulfide isomerase
VPADTNRTTSKREAARRRIEEKRAAEAAARARAQHRQRTVVGGIVAGVLLVVAVIVVIAVQSSRTSTSADAQVPAGTVDDGTGIPVGDSAAPVTVDVYEDFQCPFCAQFEAMTGDTLDQLVASGQARIVYHPIAILDRASTTDYSTRALNAAGVVLDEAGLDAFAQFHDLLFANQPAEGTAGLTDDELVDFAAQAGATGDAVANGIRDRTFEDWTKQVTDASSQAGVTGTPTVLVDGEKLDTSLLTPDGLTSAVEAAQAG